MSEAAQNLTRGLGDRREYERVPLKAWVFLDDEQKHHVGLTFDFSIGGLGLICSSKVPLGKRVQVWMLSPMGGDFETTAVVVHVRKQQVGIKFTKSDDEWQNLYRALRVGEHSAVHPVPSARSIKGG